MTRATGFLLHPEQLAPQARGVGAGILLLVIRQHALRTFNALTKGILEQAIPFAFLNVSSDCQADHLRNRLLVNSSDGVQFLRLFGR